MTAIPTPASHGLPYMAPLLKTPDGINLTCYLIPQTRISLDSSYKPTTEMIVDERVELTDAAADARATVIVFHGNSMHNYEDFGSAHKLHRMKCNVLLISYRGYVWLVFKRFFSTICWIGIAFLEGNHPKRVWIHSLSVVYSYDTK